MFLGFEGLGLEPKTICFGTLCPPLGVLEGFACLPAPGAACDTQEHRYDRVCPGFVAVRSNAPGLAFHLFSTLLCQSRADAILPDHEVEGSGFES